jgi:hypothetical protein
MKKAIAHDTEFLTTAFVRIAYTSGVASGISETQKISMGQKNKENKRDQHDRLFITVKPVKLNTCIS